MDRVKGTLITNNNSVKINSLDKILYELNQHDSIAQNKANSLSKNLNIEILANSGIKNLSSSIDIISTFEKFLSNKNKALELYENYKLDKKYKTNKFTRNFLSKIAREEISSFSANLIADTLITANIPAKIIMKTLGADFIEMASYDIPVLHEELKKSFKAGYLINGKKEYKFISYQKELASRLSKFIRKLMDYNSFNEIMRSKKKLATF